MLIIKEIEKNSIGEEIGLEVGDAVLKFDGYETVDILDYLYYDSKESFTMTIGTRGKEVECEIEKDDDETLGLTFVSDGLEMRLCRNNCIFCFVAQLPKGLRESLYVKDDDYRQSFLCGNYVTLTNVTDSDIERIIRLHLSPLYISVHTLYQNLRSQMLNNRFADRLYDMIKRLSDGGIEIHAQIVLVKGVNDGVALEQTCAMLSQIKNVKTLAVVPCGISGHREGLTKIDDIDQEYSKNLILTVDALNKKSGRNFIFAADDFYVRAKISFPEYEVYGNFDQIENGVGMFASFMHDYNEVCQKSTYRRTFLIVTGVAAKPFIEEYAKKTEDFCNGLKVYVIAPVNKFFGPTITAAGLLTGGDISEAILNFDKEFDEVMLPKNMMKETENVFLDGMTLETLQNLVGKPVKLAEVTGNHFFNILTGKE